MYEAMSITSNSIMLIFFEISSYFKWRDVGDGI